MSNKNLAIIMFFCLIPSASAAHYITGFVNNAKDGGSPDGLAVVLWKPSLGLSDNVTDIIGSTGNSGASGTYLIDCEMLSSPCEVGDIVSVALSQFTPRNVSGEVTGFGFDVLPNLTISAFPNIPGEHHNILLSPGIRR
jgi:hypothetical protein